jgi:chemotaxis protein methyltransferase CheR
MLVGSKTGQFNDLRQGTFYGGKFFDAVLSKDDFKRLSEFVREISGIKLPPGKKTLVEGRLRKRLRSLQMESYEDYCNYLFSPAGIESELIHMIDVITTNKTDFFREPEHFDYLVKKVLPELSGKGLGRRQRLNVWSAGCSSGEEPFTLAMVLSEFRERRSDFNFSILGTDICTKVLEKAARGIYPHERIEPVPMTLRKKYLLKSKDKSYSLVKIAPELRSLVKFERLNFMDVDFRIREPIAVIFCRNVLIYFDRQTQEQLLSRFCRYLIPGGYLFTGHSETLQGMNLPLDNIAATVYRKI